MIIGKNLPVSIGEVIYLINCTYRFAKEIHWVKSDINPGYRIG